MHLETQTSFQILILDTIFSNISFDYNNFILKFILFDIGTHKIPLSESVIATINLKTIFNKIENNKPILSSSNLFFSFEYPVGIKYNTKIRLRVTHLLREHKFKHSLQYSINSLCS